MIRIFGVAASNWMQFHGWSLEHGINLRKLTAEEFCHLVEYWVTRNMDEKERRKFDFDSWVPPKGVEPDDDHPYFGDRAESEAWEKSKGSNLVRKA